MSGGLSKARETEEGVDVGRRAEEGGSTNLIISWFFCVII
jgi:hypothetical protein